MLFCSSAHAQQQIELSIQGANEAQQQNIRAHLGSLPTEPHQINAFIAKAREKTLSALVALGYNNAHAKVQVNREVQPLRVTISVDPGAPTRITQMDLSLKGDGLDDDEFQQLLAGIIQQQGQILNHQSYESWKDRIQTYARNHGYLSAKWITHELRVNTETREARVILEFDTGVRHQVGEVNYKGSDVSRELLERMSPLTLGEPYQSSLLSSLESALRRSGYFDDVLVTPDLNKVHDHQVPINVALSDAPTHSFKVGVGYVTDTGPRAQFNWRTPRINRYGHSQETTLRYSTVNPYINFFYQIPGEDPLNEHYLISLGLEQNDYGDLTSTQKRLALSRQSTHKKWVWATQLRWLDENWNFAEQDYRAQYLLPGLTLSRTRREGPIRDPEAGFLQNYQVEATDQNLGSGGRLLRLTGFWKWLHRWGDHRVVLRGQAGINVTEEEGVESLAPSLRFFAGGDQSIRGFDYNSLGPTTTVQTDDGPEQRVIGGKMLAVASAEYQYYLYDDWRLAIFTDAGNAFNRDKFNPVQSVGTGVHWLSPVGAVRVEVAYGISEEDRPWRLHISMGAEL
ncbi:autotransporter assembly complex protein TamA [Bowmanella dokdonensis]|uniref:Translocation and assembly module subunit TamA n=1 Tax=Bowmanella dokdonensis TaxID=751969 RepID=A0A939DK20_9ALTE|nr:autotransporter assembly complex family protein [Bowmanella dokdonensis]MBN7824179.1 outer membrane protein assembly factor [Bowmanella dokdonensis]